jgi:carbon starvation protein
MNVFVLMGAAVPFYCLASVFYSRYLSRQMGEDAARPTPAVSMTDGRDYCPSRTWVVFSHHFASIAGAGPILGPVLAIPYGIGPVWLWVVVGGITIGAVHDYTALFLSIRERGRSIAEVVRSTMGKGPFLLMVGFIVMMLVLVTGSFLRASATALTSLVPLSDLQLGPGQTVLDTVEEGGVVKGMIGGIASTSVIVITLIAPLVGYLHYKKKASLVPVSLLAIGACFVSVLVGLRWPVRLPTNAWMLALTFYTLIASAIPVWFILQPRDFTNVFILYAGVLLLVVSAIGCGLRGPAVAAVQHPMWSPGAATAAGLGYIWPALFITVACGAVSGFHALVAGGTVSKQITSEPAARRVGYSAMLLESLLAIGVICALAVGISPASYQQIVIQTKPSNPVLAFALAAGVFFNKGLGVPVFAGTIFGILMVEGFVATTLDTAVRLNRYLMEEFWTTVLKKVPRVLRHPWFNSAIAAGLMLLFAWTNALSAIWALFGTANQLLAAFTLITVMTWLAARNRKTWFVAIPAAFMLVTTSASLLILGKGFLDKQKLLLGASDAILILLTIGLVAVTGRTLLATRRARAMSLAAGEAAPE